MKIIHVADLHANKERKDEVLHVLDTLLSRVQKGDIDYLLFAGDFWDSTITNTAASGFPEFVFKVQEIAALTEVVMISGTPLHEPYGSLDIFRTCGVTVCDNISFIADEKVDLLCLPEPRRSDYVKKTSKEIDTLIREQYTNVIKNTRKGLRPLVIVYHGDVESAVYQNGFKVSTQTAISQELLKSTNADYIACGHIHRKQELFENCWYSGSCYLKNSGETHDCGYNLVTIDNNKTSVECISFGFPQNETVVCTEKDFDKLIAKDFTGKNITIKLQIDKALKNISFEEKLELIKEKTNANSISLKFVYNNTPTVRAKEIVEKQSLFEKFKLFQNINNIPVTDNQKKILDILEDHIRTESIFPSDSFDLEYLSIRGSIGLKDGLGIDDYEIDFTSFNDGLVAIIGKNGRGKTTIIENCHPFPQMLTRTGSLKEHFYLKDSHRILIYKTSSGRLKITMQIDAVSKGSESKYFVEVEQNGCWKPLKSVDGSLTSYKEFVEKTFGTVDVFLRTAFFAREQVKSVPDISRATRGEKISLFSTLAGIDYFNQVVELSKKAQKEEETIVNKLKLDNANLSLVLKNIKTIQEQIEQKQELLKDCIKNKPKFESELKELEEKQSVINEQVLEQKRLKTEYELLSSQITEKENSVSEATKEISNIENYLKVLKIEELLKDCEEKESEMKSLEENKAVLKKKLKTLKNKTVFNSEMADELDSVSLQISQLENLKNRNSVNIVEVDEFCPTCGQTLPKWKISELKDIVNNAQQKDLEYSRNLSGLKFKKDVLLENKNKQKETDNEMCSIQRRIESLEEKIEDLECFILENDIQGKKVELATKKEKLSLKKDFIKCTQEELLKLQGQQERIKSSFIELEDFSLDIANIKQQLRLIEVNENRLNAEISVLSEDLDRNETEREKLFNVEKEISEREQTIADLEIIAKTFGPTGIPTIELDSVAPEISDITNNILTETYGDKFKISFTTQREGSGGKKIEDFIINIFDTDKGRMKTLDLLSSGESIWIKQALFFAFSVLRSRRTGFKYRTRFLDESDGALDSEGRLLYLKMIEAANKACNARLSLLITHSSELKEVIEQKIELV